MGDWTAELERLFKQKEFQYWQEQKDQYVSNQIEYFGHEDPVSTTDRKGLAGLKEWDPQWLQDEIEAALDRDVERAFQRDGEILVEDLTAEATRKEREQQALKQLEEELAKADEENKKDKEEKDKKDKDKEEEDKDKETSKQETSEDDEDDESEDDEEGDDSEAADAGTGDPGEPAAMPTEGDDYVGVVRRFWGGPGPIDPTDVEDSQRLVQLVGGEVPIEPWDSYDGIGEVTRIYGGDEPTPAWEKIGPKFRPI